jgi:hypothetical protein
MRFHKYVVKVAFHTLLYLYFYGKVQYLSIKTEILLIDTLISTFRTRRTAMFGKDKSNKISTDNCERQNERDERMGGST